MNSKKTAGIEMTINSIDHSQQKAVKVAGFTLIFSIAIVIISNYSVTFRYIIPGNVSETAGNIIEYETMFRINVVSNLIYIVTLIFMLTSFYVILKPVNKNLALTAVFIRFVYALVWTLMTINILGAIRLLGDAPYLSVFELDQLQTMARLQLSNSWDAYYVGLPFWGVTSFIISWLLFNSRYIPRALSIFGIISSVWCVCCGFAYLIYPDYGKIIHIGLFDVPLTIFEIILGFWLLIKGIKTDK